MTPSVPCARSVVTDLTVCFIPRGAAVSTCALDSRKWHRIKKELYLHTSEQSAWLYVALADEKDIKAEDLLVMDIRVGKQPPSASGPWEGRPCGIWLLRSLSVNIERAVTDIDVLFGQDAVDPRPQWTLIRPSLQLNGLPEVPGARLSVLYGRARPISDTRTALRVRENGKFKIVQISDMHMVTGVGVCNDAIDAKGNNLPESEADPLTVNFIGKILDLEKPDLVVFTGDQLHHDTPDSQTALFKATAPLIERSIPFAVVFGNHDSEGAHALSREAQMTILQSLPFNLSEPGPEQVEGIGNFCLKIMAPDPSLLSLSTLYFLDSHGQIPSKIRNPDYDSIKQSQIEWFTRSAQQSKRERDANVSHLHLSLVFQHIPLPEFRESRLSIRTGHQREPPESPSVNSNFYDALKRRRTTKNLHSLALGYAMEEVVDLGDIARMTESVTTGECGFGN
ncbi:hypothetical protein Q7P37_009809 [Cladosporium fusiforme]